MVRVVEKAPCKTTTCYHCKAKLEYDYIDISVGYVKDWDGGGDTYYRIVCPQCNLKNNVSKWGN